MQGLLNQLVDCPGIRERLDTLWIGRQSPRLGDQGVDAVVSALGSWEWPHLESVTLDACGMSDSAALSVAGMLSRCPGLRWLWICDNEIGDDGGKALVTAVSTYCPRMELVWLIKGSSISKAGRAALRAIPGRELTIR